METFNKHHHVRVLLDGTGFADVGEHGAVVGAARGRAGELGKSGWGMGI